jgi:hypothetical protein
MEIHNPKQYSALQIGNGVLFLLASIYDPCRRVYRGFTWNLNLVDEALPMTVRFGLSTVFFAKRKTYSKPYRMVVIGAIHGEIIDGIPKVTMLDKCTCFCTKCSDECIHPCDCGNWIDVKSITQPLFESKLTTHVHFAVCHIGKGLEYATAGCPSGCTVSGYTGYIRTMPYLQRDIIRMYTGSGNTSRYFNRVTATVCPPPPPHPLPPD